MTSPDEADPLVDELLPRMAELDESLAQGDASSAHDPAAIPPGLQPRWQRLQACIRLLRQSLAKPTKPADPPDAIDVEALTGWQFARQFGRFRIVRELGRGGFGIVYLAEDPHLQRPVALKVPRPEALANPNLRERFLREARAAAGLDHPNLVAVYEAGEVGPVCYIASAYCPGTNLALWLREQREPVASRQAAALVATMAEAVQHAHDRGILHRDLKPANILLTPHPDNPVASPDELPFLPRLTDFGLAKLLEAEADLTTSGALLGTPAYMAPEQAEGWSEAVGAPTDVYALGVILYELLTRRLPCAGPSLVLTLEQVRSAAPVPPRQWRPDLPQDLETIALQSLHKEPGRRYASAGALAEDLRCFLRDEPIQARRPGFLEGLRSWSRRPQRIRDAAVVAGFFCAVTVASVSVGVFLALSGLMAVEDLGTALAFELMQLFGVPVASWWIIRGTVRRDVRALWGGLIFPFLFAAFQVVSISHTSATGGMVDMSQSSNAWYALATTLAVIEFIQGGSFALALVAYYANRHIPGFVPERTAASQSVSVSARSH